jgi:hypothetical protein
VGNGGQHGKREATREGASNCAPDQQQTHVHQQALPHQQQTPPPKDITCNNRTHSNRNRARTSGKEAERIQEPLHTKAADSRRVKRVNMQCLAHVRIRDSVTRQEIQKIKPQISRIRALKRGSLAAGEEMLDAAPAAFHKGVPPSSTGRWPSDANLAVKTRTEPMQREGVPRHRVTERKVAREDTKERVHKRSRKVQERQRGGSA